MAEPGTIRLNNVTYPLVKDEGTLKGRRAYTKLRRPSRDTDPSRPKDFVWQTWGPIGQSREADNGFLGVDYVQNLATDNDHLLTSSAARNTITLSSQDPSESDGFLPQLLPFTLGGFTAGNVSHILEIGTRTLFARDNALTTVTMSDATVTDTNARGTTIEGLATWKNKARVSYGNAQDMDTVDNFIANRPQLTAITGVRAKEMTIGTDRWWGVRGDSGGSEENQLFYSLDDFASVSNRFEVGDDKIPHGALTAVGNYVIVATENGAFSFTDVGKPVPFLKALDQHRSINNGVSVAEAWGWAYVCTDLGLWAINPDTLTANPVGPDANPGFEGPAGRPTAVFHYKDSLWLAELVGSDLYASRGRFIEGRTPATGQLDWFHFHFQTGVQCDAIGATNSRTNPTVVFGETGNAAYYTLSRRRREIADSNYVFGTTGGTWFGSTTRGRGATHFMPRYASFMSENCDANNTWQLALSPDEGAYVNVGSAVTSNGHQVLRPVSGGVPLATVDFHTAKPRMVQVAASSSSPPQIRGTLTLTCDERPDKVIEIDAAVLLGVSARSAFTDQAALEALDNHDTADLVTVSLPGDNTTYYGHVTNVDATDRTGDVWMAGLRITIWDTA